MRRKAEIEEQFKRANPKHVEVTDGNQAFEEAFRQGVSWALGWVLHPEAYTTPPTKMFTQIRKVRTGM